MGYTGSDTALTLPTLTDNEGNTINYSIYQYAFYENKNITSVIIPDCVTSIGAYAFYYCTSLTSIIIPDSVTSIAVAAFRGCSSLSSITLPFVCGSADASEASASTLFGYIFGTSSYSGSTAIKQYYSSNNYTTYYIPNTLTNVVITGSDILYGAFYNCISIISVTIGSSVTSIGDNAFYGCYKLIEVYNLSSFEITSGSSSYVASYAKHVYTSGESNLIIEDDYIFYNADGTYYLMGYMGSDTKLVLPTLTINGATISYSIYQYAFYYDTSITNVTISDNVTSIGSYALYNCSSLTSITIPDSVTSIGSSAFYDCVSLTSITIPDGIKSIGRYAFCNCTSLISVMFENTDGWYITKTEGATSGTSVTVTNARTNAVYFISSY